MTPSPLARRPARIAAGALSLGLAASSASAQSREATFSVDWQGQTVGENDSLTNTPITSGDVLIQPFGPFPQPGQPLPPPGILRKADFLSLYSACVGSQPGFACGVELDAVSFGRDRAASTDTSVFDVYFSVDEFSQGRPPLPALPNAIFDEAQAREAAGDVFFRRFAGAGPFAPGGPYRSDQLLDGNGRTPAGQPRRGLGLVEPIQPSAGVPESGSNLDAFDQGPPADPFFDVVFFSLQSDLRDPLEPGVTFSDAAGNEGRSGADILFFDPQNPTAGVQLYAQAADLGLDAVVDDVDAILILENGIPGFQKPMSLYDWDGGASDLVLFSVRRGSAIVGVPDGLQGLAISEADVLLPPLGAGMLGSPPGVFVPGEQLGLNTGRTGAPSDELDGLDGDEDPFEDCNDNGVEDAKDISDGTSSDVDGNGVPDECEPPGTPYCDCDTGGESPCGNTAGADEGCENNVGTGGKMVGTGTSSLATDSLAFMVSQVTPSTFAVVFTGDGTGPHTTVDNGSRCVAPGAQGVFRLAIEPTGSGSFSYGPGIVGASSSLPSPPTILAGSTWYFQSWYRDIGGPCGGFSNMTNGWMVTFTP